MSPSAADAGDRVVVIGSGPCGATAARELTRAGVSVTVLEAGLHPPRGVIVRVAGHTMFRWRSQRDLLTDRHVALGDPATEWFSSLSPGGLSNYWTAAVPRFAPEDFSDGSRIDERFGWPVRYDELSPFYEIAEDLLGITGPSASLPTLPAGRVRYHKTMPLDWIALAGERYASEMTVLPMARGRRWMLARRGSEFNSYHVIIQPLQGSPSFELRLGALATRLVVSKTADRATGVEYIDSATGVRSVIPARAVVLAAGAIDSTRILLSSTSPAAPRGVGNDAGLVGRYLHDHPKEWWPAEFERPLTLLDHPVYLARQPYAASPPLHGSSATVGLYSQRDRPLSILGRKGRRFGVQVFGMMIPDDRCAVQLIERRSDSRGLPMVDIDMRYDDAALGTLRDLRERFENVFGEAGNPVRSLPVDWVPRPGSSVHYGGTIRMHERPEFGVLDRWNRVRGTPNVVVADMSCFPTNPEKNPTLTAMALAARAARQLATYG